MSEPAWQAGVREQLSGLRVLLVNSKGFELPQGSEVAAPSDALAQGQSFDGIFWQPRSPVSSGIATLKKLLLPAGRLLVWVDAARGPEAFFKLLLSRPSGPNIPLEEVCEAVLLAGLLEPRVLYQGKRGFVVSASQPAALGMLDALFSQP